MDENTKFISLLKKELAEKSLVKIVLGKYRGDENLKKITVKQLDIKGKKQFSFLYSYKTQDITKNYNLQEGINLIDELMGNPFKSVNLFSTTEDVQIEFSRKGKCKWSSSKPQLNADSAKHNREKKRFLKLNEQFLFELGITDKNQKLIPSMSRKWKQINKFLEVFDNAFNSSQLINKEDISVADFGSGKGYLTFAIHEYLRNSLNKKPFVTGIELRDNLVDFCNIVSNNLKLDSISFHQGDIKDFKSKNIDIMIGLHACDIATDLAIHLGIKSNAEIIMCAPCCHKQIRQQMNAPEILEPMLSFGIHLGQEAEMITDSLRALLLEANGYKTKLFEFVSLEHTSKNKMLLGIKDRNKKDSKKIFAQIAKIKDFYGIKEHYLETLLK